MDDSVVKGFVEFGTIVVKIIDKIGLIPTLLSAVGITKILPSILKAVTGAEKFTGMLKAFAFGAEYANNSIGEIIISISKASATAAKNIPTWVSLGKELGGVKGAAIGLTDGLSKLWATIPGVGKIMLIAATIGAVVAIIDGLTNSTKELKEKISELDSEIKSIQSELDSLNSELETTQSRMEELLSMDSLSFTEEEELKNLQKQNNELERQIYLLEQREKRKQKEKEDTFVEFMENDLNTKQATMGGGAYVSNKSLINSYMISYERALSEVAIAEQDLIDAEKSQDAKAIKKAENNYEKKQKEAETYYNFLDDKIQEYSDEASIIDYGLANDEIKEYLDYIYDLEDKFDILQGGTKKYAINRIFNKEEYKEVSNTIDDLVEKLENGVDKEAICNQIEGIILQNDDLVTKLKELGITAEEAAKSFSYLDEAEKAAAEVQESSITDTLTSISSLEDVFNSFGDAVKEFKEDGTTSASTLKSLSESFGEIEGFEELYKVLATGEGNVEEAITNVANAYIAQKGMLSELSEEEQAIMIARLKSLGVINAEEVFQVKQKAQEELNALGEQYSIDLSNYATAEEAKLAIAQQLGLDVASIQDDQIETLAKKYGIDLSNYATVAEQKIAIAKKVARETAETNRATALSNLDREYGGNRAFVGSPEYNKKKQQIEDDYKAAIAAIPSDTISNQIKGIVENAYSSLKFDFSDNKVGIGRDYKDTIGGSGLDSESALEKLKKKYENKISLLEAQQTYLENEISRLEASDQQVSRDLYDEQIKLEQQKLKLYEEERKELLAQMSTVAKNSDEWNEYAQSIWEVEHAIQETTISIVELQKKIAQLYIDVFNKIEEAYGREQSLHDKRIQYLEDEIELLKLRNEYATISPETYNQLSAEEDAKIQSNQNEIARLKALLQKGINENGDALTEEDIADMLDTIYENEADIRQSEINKAKYEQEKRQAYLDRFNNTAEAYDNLANVYQGNYDNAEQYKKYADLYGISIPKEILDYQSNQLEQQVQVTLNKKAELERQLAEAIASGDIAVGDSQWLEMVNAINDCTSAANDFKYQITEIEQEIKALSVDKFNDIKDAFNNVDDVFNDRQSYIEEYMNYLEALGIDVPAEMYEELIANEEDRQASNRASLESLRRQLAEMEANGYTAEDDEWVQAQADIRALEKEILASETAMAQWNKTIQEMSFEKFDEFLKRISDICDELENVYGLISDEDVALEDGSWTEEGIMSLGLMTQKMAIAKQQAEEYAKEIDKLNEEYKKGTMSEQDYYDRLMELKNGQWESINAYKEAKDAIVDINEARIDQVENGIQKEIDAFEELIDIKKKELDAERDLYEFRNNIKNQTKEISILERKIAAMSGSTDAATIAEKNKLLAELQDAQASLDDTYYNHAKDSISNAYDDELDSYTKSKEDYIEQLREALENVEQVVADSMAQVLINADSILTGLNGISSEYGVTLSDYLMLPWQNAALQATAYKESGILDLADFTEQTGIYNGLITEQINTLFGNGSLAAGLFQTSVEGVVESIGVTVNESTSPLTSNLQLPWETVKNYAQNTFAPEVMGALQNVANDASGKKEQLTNDLISAFQAGVENAEEFNSTVIDALNNVIGKSNEFASVVPPNVSAPSDDPWDLWSNNIQSLIQKIIDKANNAVTAINNMNSAVSGAQNISNTIGNIGNIGTTGKNNTSNSNLQKDSNDSSKDSTKIGYKIPTPSVSDVKALQNVLNSLFSAGLTVDGKLGPATKAAIVKAQKTMYQYGNESMKTQDGLYGVATRAAMVDYIDKKINNLRNQGGSIAVGQGIQRYENIKKQLPKAFYAKGTLGTKKDEWAIDSEPQYGDELVLVPNKGVISYMRKGTSVIPADITENLMKWGQFTPNMNMSSTVQGMNLMSNYISKPNIDITFDALVKAESITEETLPAVKKLVTEELDKFSRQLNYSLRRVGAK